MAQTNRGTFAERAKARHAAKAAAAFRTKNPSAPATSGVGKMYGATAFRPRAKKLKVR